MKKNKAKSIRLFYNKKHTTTRKESKQKWCYLSKNHFEQPEIKEAITKQLTTQNTTQKIINTTQNINKSEMLKSSSFKAKKPNQPFDQFSLVDTHQQCKLNRIY